MGKMATGKKKKLKAKKQTAPKRRPAPAPEPGPKKKQTLVEKVWEDLEPRLEVLWQSDTVPKETWVDAWKRLIGKHGKQILNLYHSEDSYLIVELVDEKMYAGLYQPGSVVIYKLHEELCARCKKKWKLDSDVLCEECCVECDTKQKTKKKG